MDWKKQMILWISVLFSSFVMVVYDTVHVIPFYSALFFPLFFSSAILFSLDAIIKNVFITCHNKEAYMFVLYIE